MRRRWWALWAAFALSLVAVELGIVFGVIIFDPLTNFYFVIVVIAAIGVLAIVGAVFIGMFMAHRMFSRQEFTPFEREMLEMREEVKRLAERFGAQDSGSPEDPQGRR